MIKLCRELSDTGIVSELGRRRFGHALFGGVALALVVAVAGLAWKTDADQRRAEVEVEARFHARIELAAGYAASLLDEVRLREVYVERGDLDDTPLAAFLGAVSSLPGRELHVVDDDGFVVASTESTAIVPFAQRTPTLASASFGTTTTDYRGEDHFVVVEPLSGSGGWRLVAAVPEGELVAPVRDGAQLLWVLVGGTAVMAAALIALLVWVSRQRDRLRAASRTDALTGLANRGRGDEIMARAAPTSQRSGVPWAVAMIDVDHFKAVNDRHGHAGGDRVLREVVAVLAHETRASDFCARWGGEEFIIVMDATDHAAARVAGERIRAAVVEATADGEQVTVSIGVAAAVGGDVDTRCCTSPMVRSTKPSAPVGTESFRLRRRSPCVA